MSYSPEPPMMPMTGWIVSVRADLLDIAIDELYSPVPLARTTIHAMLEARPPVDRPASKPGALDPTGQDAG
jgi:hypothetical protein